MKIRIKWTDRGDAHDLAVGLDDEIGDLEIQEPPNVYRFGYGAFDPDHLNNRLHCSMQDDLDAGVYAGSFEIIEEPGISGRETMGTVEWSLVPETEHERAWLGRAGK